jgi:hypothetical protein
VKRWFIAVTTPLWAVSYLFVTSFLHSHKSPVLIIIPSDIVKRQPLSRPRTNPNPILIQLVPPIHLAHLSVQHSRFQFLQLISLLDIEALNLFTHAIRQYLRIHCAHIHTSSI